MNGHGTTGVVSATKSFKDMDIDFADIMTALGQGETSAKNLVLQNCLASVNEAIVRKFGSTARAADAVQSAFRTFFGRPVASRKNASKKINNWGELTGLLVRIAGNKWLNQRSRDRREGSLPDIPLADVRSEQPIDEIVAKEDLAKQVPIRESALNELVRQLEAAEDRLRSNISGLSAALTDRTDREILRMRIEGRSFQQIADEVSRQRKQGITEDAVRQRWNRKLAPRVLGMEELEDPDLSDDRAARCSDSLRADVFTVVATIQSALLPHEFIIFRGMLDGRLASGIADELQRSGEAPKSADMVQHLWDDRIWAKVERILAEHLAASFPETLS